MKEDKLIADLLQIIRVYRATAADTRALVAKRQVWRQKNNYPEDEMIEEIADLNHDAMVSERVIYNNYKHNEDLRRKWLGTMPQYVD